jgi:hypothetical protein
LELAWGFKLKGETMTKLGEVVKEIERLRSLVADKKKQIKRIDESLILLGSTKDDLLDEVDDLLSKLTFNYQKEKDLT